MADTIAGVGEKAVIAVATNADEQNNLIEIQKKPELIYMDSGFCYRNV